VAPDLDAWRLLDAVGQVAGHVPPQVVVSDDQVDHWRLAGQEAGRLTCGVAAAHNGDGVLSAQPGLEFRGGVVDAAALEAVRPRDVEASVAHAGGDEHGVCDQVVPLCQPHHVVTVGLCEGGRLAGDVEDGAELAGLDYSAVGQLAAGDAGGEP
jgi:hypothetical protein